MTYLRNVSTLTYEMERCIGCGGCVSVCPHAVFGMADGKAVILERDRCMECGACMLNCPPGALWVEKGVGCAAAVIGSKLRGKEEVTCGCGGGECCGG